MEPNCLLGLQMTHPNILAEIDLTEKGNQEGTNHADGVDHMTLLGGVEEVIDSSSCISTSMDFEFTSHDYSMDSTSVFDITESVIGGKVESTDLFIDSNIFEDGAIKQNFNGERISAASFTGKRVSLGADLGLNLQIIPLNNLQFISTIQTSEGLHILAVPGRSNVCETVQNGPPLNDIANLDVVNTDIGDMNSDLKICLPGEDDDVTMGWHGNKDKNLPTNSGKELKFTNISSNTNSTIQVVKIKHPHSNTEEANIKKNKIEMFGVNTINSMNEPPIHISQLSLDRFNKIPCRLPVPRNSDKILCTKHNIKSDMNSGVILKQVCKKKNCKKESKIFIDLRKIVPSRKKRLVSLLNKSTKDKLRVLQSKRNKSTHSSFSKLKNANNCNEVAIKKSLTATCDHTPDKGKCFKSEKNKYISNPLQAKLEKNKDKTGQIKKKSAKYKSSSSYRCKLCLAYFTKFGNFKNHVLMHKNITNKERKFNGTTDVKDIDIDDFVLKTVQDKHKPTTLNSVTTTNVVPDNSAEYLNPDKSAENIHLVISADNVHPVTSIENVYHIPSTEKVHSVTSTVKSIEKVHTIPSTENVHDVKSTVKSTEIVQSITSAVKSTEKVHPVTSTVQLTNDLSVNAANTTVTKSLTNSPLICELCSLTFASQGNLTRHRLTHSSDGQSTARYTCDTCNKGFLQRCDLKRHEMVHSHDLPYTCTSCQKGFIRKSDLVTHEKFHTKEKCFGCKLCSKAYYQSGDLQRHIRQNHGSVCDFTCIHCDKKYLTLRTLSQHVRQKHTENTVSTR